MNRKPLPPPPRPALADWLRRGLAPSALHRHWRPHLAVILLLAAAGCLVRWGGLLSGWQRAALWGALVSAVAFLSRRAWGRLFGPVLFYDLVRTARRGRGFVLRGAYALALLVVLAVVYATEFGSEGTLFDSLFGEARAGIQQLADFGSGFFLTFLSVQLAAVFLLTPALAATAIAEEKERKTLDYLLATDLSNREIILGKLTSRLLAMLLLLLGGLPVLSFVQFLGGVDPNLVLAGFAATAASMLSLGSLGIVYSVYADRSLHAVLSTYVVAALYLTLSSCCGGMAIRSGYFAPVVWPAAGNVFIAYARIENGAGSSGGMTGAAVMPVLAEYVVFHGVATVFLVVLATAKLRGWYREARPKSEREALPAGKAPAPANALTLPPRLPRVGPDPVLWKELYAEHGLRPPALVRGLFTFVAVAFLFAAGMIYLCGILISLAFHEPSAFATNWVRAVGTTVGCLMVLGVGLRAATALSRERERQTLDSLLTTPLSNAAILGGKWWGAVRSVAPLGWCLAAVWALGFLAGGLHVISVALLLAAWCAYAAFAAGLGLWFSLHCRTTFRATAWTLVALLLAGCLPLLLCGPSGLALTPEGAPAYLAFGWGEWYTFEPALRSSAGQVAVAWAGVCGYALAAGALWLAVGARFGPVTGRASSSR